MVEVRLDGAVNVRRDWADVGDTDQLQADAVAVAAAYPSDQGLVDLRADAMAGSDTFHYLSGRTLQALREAYGGDLMLDCSILMRLRPGGGHGLHADAENLDGSPNHTGHRTHVGLVYLTTDDVDYEGGQLILCGVQMPAERGMLLMFPATAAFPHEVLPLTKGTRWALATWTRR